jgi:hypothetical protein
MPGSSHFLTILSFLTAKLLPRQVHQTMLAFGHVAEAHAGSGDALPHLLT